LLMLPLRAPYLSICRRLNRSPALFWSIQALIWVF
jgi:hypothetical protein